MKDKAGNEIVEEVETETLPEGVDESGEELEQEVTVDPGLAEEVDENQQLDGEAEKEKTFTQKELDGVVEGRLARERRKVAREQAALIEEPLQIDSQLDPEAFASTEDYVTALANEKANAIVAHRDQKQSVNVIEEQYQTQVDEVLDKYPDYIQVAHTHKFMSNEMASVIKSSDIATDLAYHLGANLDEAERIFKLPPVRQIVELGKLEANLEKTPPEAKTTSAPAPIKPVQKGKTTVPAFDTTDPRSAEKMSASEWIAADRKRRGFKP